MSDDNKSVLDLVHPEVDNEPPEPTDPTERTRQRMSPVIWGLVAGVVLVGALMLLGTLPIGN